MRYAATWASLCTQPRSQESSPLGSQQLLGDHAELPDCAHGPDVDGFGRTAVRGRWLGAVMIERCAQWHAARSDKALLTGG